MERRRRTRDEWRALLAEQRETGERDAEFAARRGLNSSTLRWWRSELRREVTERFVGELRISPDWDTYLAIIGTPISGALGQRSVAT